MQRSLPKTIRAGDNNYFQFTVRRSGERTHASVGGFLLSPSRRGRRISNVRRLYGRYEPTRNRRGFSLVRCVPCLGDLRMLLVEAASGVEARSLWPRRKLLRSLGALVPGPSSLKWSGCRRRSPPRFAARLWRRDRAAWRPLTRRRRILCLFAIGLLESQHGSHRNAAGIAK
jgi:hypothetical protein